MRGLDGAIVSCRFIHLKSDFIYSHAFGAPLCEGNEVIDCEAGFYLEPARSANWDLDRSEKPVPRYQRGGNGQMASCRQFEHDSVRG